MVAMGIQRFRGWTKKGCYGNPKVQRVDQEGLLWESKGSEGGPRRVARESKGSEGGSKKGCPGHPGADTEAGSRNTSRVGSRSDCEFGQRVARP